MRLVRSRNSKLKNIFLIPFFLSVCLVPAKAQDSRDSEDDTGTLFYPSLPEIPRIQFLTSFSVAADVREENKKKSSWLSDFVLGDENLEDEEVLNKPYGVTISKGQVHVVDTRGGGYAIFDVAAKDYRFILGSGSAVMAKPVNIEIDNEGRKYVTDTDRGQIFAFDSNDKFLMAYGKRWQFRPADVVVDEDRLYVVDIQGHKVVVLDKNTGDELSSFGGAGVEKNRFFQPTNIALGPDKHLYISDTGNFRVQKFTQDGEFVRSFGAGVGTAPGDFARPKGVAVDRMGRLYVVDAAFETVQLFNSEGDLLLYFGEPASTHRGGLDLPADIDIDYDSVSFFQQYADPSFELEYIIAVANQFGRNRVNVFGFGRHESMANEDE